ncbi:MAG: UbiA family prenyltransferase [Proteobacteria bacterium]|nr:UbiA family prenyltransferase [Pseudomonadota bacterium]
MTPLKNRFDAYEQMLRLHQPAGVLLLLWPVLSALWLATGGRPPLSLVIIFVMGTLLMRSVGCALGDWLDHNKGRNNGGSDRGDGQRTADNRAGLLERGVIAPWEALAVAVVLTLIAFGFIWFTTRIAIGIAAVALVSALALALVQLFYRRFVSLSRVFFGIAFLFGIPLAFAAANNTVPWYAWGLMGVHVFWIVAYDIEYAMARRDKDIERDRRSSALILGRYDVLATAVSYGLYLAGMVGVGLWWRLGIAYGVALALATACAVGCLWLAHSRKTSHCFAAFRCNHWIGVVIFIGVVADYALRLHSWPMLGR